MQLEKIQDPALFYSPDEQRICSESVHSINLETVKQSVRESMGNIETPILFQSWGDCETWRELPQRFFVLVGDSDDLIPIPAVEWLFQQLPERSQLHVEKSCTHGGSFLVDRLRLGFDFIEEALQEDKAPKAKVKRLFEIAKHSQT